MYKTCILYIIKDVCILQWGFSLVVRLPHAALGYWGLIPGLGPHSCFLLEDTFAGSGDGSDHWVPANEIGDVGCVLCS